MLIKFAYLWFQFSNHKNLNVGMTKRHYETSVNVATLQCGELACFHNGVVEQQELRDFSEVPCSELQAFHCSILQSKYKYLE